MIRVLSSAKTEDRYQTGWNGNSSRVTCLYHQRQKDRGALDAVLFLPLPRCLSRPQVKWGCEVP